MSSVKMRSESVETLHCLIICQEFWNFYIFIDY